MKAEERAAQIWSVLALAAQNRQILTYRMVSQLIGVPTVGLGGLLDPIQSYCLVHKLPPLPVLVVQEGTGLPGPGFNAAQDIPAAQSQVFVYDWLERGAPSPADLAEAGRKSPSNAEGKQA